MLRALLNTSYRVSISGEVKSIIHNLLYITRHPATPLLTCKLSLLSLVSETTGETDQSDQPQVSTPVQQVLAELG